MSNQIITTTAISKLMKTKVVTLHPKEAMLKVKEIFDSKEFHHIPVVNEQNEVLGMLSRRDYDRILSCHMLFNKEKNEQYNLRNLESIQVEDVMNKDVVTVGQTDELTKAAALFKENLFHALPVVDEQNKLIGIVTTYDLLVFAYQ